MRGNQKSLGQEGEWRSRAELLGAAHKQFVWGKNLWQLGRVCPGVLLRQLPTSVAFRNGCACGLPSRTFPTPSPDSVPPCPGSGCPGGARGWTEPVQAESAGAAIAAAERGGSPSCGKGTLESERKGNFLEEEVASVSPYMPSCEWLGRGYQLVWLPLRHPPQPLIPGGSGKANGDSFSKMLPDFPSSSTCPSLPPPERQTGVHKNPANTSLGVGSCLTLWERDRDTTRFHTQIQHPPFLPSHILNTHQLIKSHLLLALRSKRK